MVSIGASQALDPGSIPGHRNFDKIKFIRATKYNTSAFFYHVNARFIIKKLPIWKCNNYEIFRFKIKKNRNFISNPLAHHTFDYPPEPSEALWDEKYLDRRGRDVKILDIGCGYGGLLIQLAKHFPDRLLLGLEIRVKVKFFSVFFGQLIPTLTLKIFQRFLTMLWIE